MFFPFPVKTIVFTKDFQWTNSSWTVFFCLGFPSLNPDLLNLRFGSLHLPNQMTNSQPSESTRLDMTCERRCSSLFFRKSNFLDQKNVCFVDSGRWFFKISAWPKRASAQNPTDVAFSSPFSWNKVTKGQSGKRLAKESITICGNWAQWITWQEDSWIIWQHHKYHSPVELKCLNLAVFLSSLAVVLHVNPVNPLAPCTNIRISPSPLLPHWPTSNFTTGMHDLMDILAYLGGVQIRHFPLHLCFQLFFHALQEGQDLAEDITPQINHHDVMPWGNPLL